VIQLNENLIIEDYVLIKKLFRTVTLKRLRNIKQKCTSFILLDKF